MKLTKAFAILSGALALAACDKNAVQDITGPMGSARVKFFNFAVNAPGVNFYANDTKMTAITSTTGTESVLGVNYGSAGAVGLYMAINPGQYSLQGKIAAATDKDLTIASANANIEAGKHYSFYMSGVYDAAAKRSDAFVVEDPVPANFDFTQAYVRFVNAISNANPMTLHVRLQATGNETAAGAAVAYKAAGAFTAVPPGLYDLATRYAGSSSNAIARTAVSFNAGRVYTITARGDITVTSTTSASRPLLDLTANR